MPPFASASPRPIEVSPPVTTDAVRRHYDKLSGLYRRWWGENIHHGFWEADESSHEAQRKLTERLARQAGIPRGAHVLDVGCGVGGPAFWLAREQDCSVHGITISPVQVELARQAARASDRVRFEVMDAGQLALPPASFDVVWVIECSEHLHDKQRFVAECSRVLKPGGKFALCAWLAEGSSPAHRPLIAEIERAMLCPSLARMSDYVQWMNEAGLTNVTADDITRHVARTWTHCLPLLREPEVQWVLRFGGEDLIRFASAFAKMEQGYATGAMSYGMFTGTKDGAC